MKFNLQNRPKLGEGLVDDLRFRAEAVRWFEGFEKELRTMKDTSNMHAESAYRLIKEILGAV
jgi:hypothetical protein